ncbi:MAG: PD-(D/E)XK nuclease family protein [Chitinophagales bacterium]
MKENINAVNEFLEDFILIKNDYLNSLIDISNSIIIQAEKVYSELQKRNKKESIFFNTLNYFKINETLHSYMIADLLNPNSTHGQGNKFLNIFLKEIGICESENPKDDIWNITAEKGRIDILLVRVTEPHSVIIVENKSNYATDQPHQLYRYWYQEIYKPNSIRKDYDFKQKETYNVPEIKKRYKIIYLPPDESKEPCKSSCQKPDWKELKDFDNDLPLNFELHTFDNLICNWLSKCIKILDKDNHRMRQYLTQYIELWK